MKPALIKYGEQDVDATMKTMVSQPYDHHVPVQTGGVGYDGVYNFYKNYFLGKMPRGTKLKRIATSKQSLMYSA